MPVGAAAMAPPDEEALVVLAAELDDADVERVVLLDPDLEEASVEAPELDDADVDAAAVAEIWTLVTDLEVLPLEVFDPPEVVDPLVVLANPQLAFHCSRNH